MIAIDKDDFKAIEKLQKGNQMDKDFINGYLGEDVFDKEDIDPKVLNREYNNNTQLDKTAYQEFWLGVRSNRFTDSRGSQGV